MNGFLDDLPEGYGFVVRRKTRRAGSVMYIRVRCPECESTECPVYSTDPIAGDLRVRHHKCRGCGATFKSVEKL